MRLGYTLPELMLVLALAGILLGIAVPRISGALDRIEVAAAANQISAAHARARLLAITRSQVVILTVDSVALTITPRSHPTPIWSGPGPARSGVSLAGGTRTFTFSPEGFTLGFSNATLRLARGFSSRAVVVSRLGRVRITP